jgi:energy-coupling factor transporter transmembrane protein EcfT
MFRIDRSAGLVLAVGLAAVIGAAVAPAGLDGRPIPVISWSIWAGVLALAFAGFGGAGVSVGRALRRMMWFLPVIALLALPAGLLSEPGRRVVVTLGLAARSFASASAAAALAALLGPAGLVEGARRLHVPSRLVEIFAAALASMTVIVRQVSAMLRAREARRPGHGAWSHLLASPLQTVRGIGRLVAALLLRALERGEAQERARRARGAADP